MKIQKELLTGREDDPNRRESKQSVWIDLKDELSCDLISKLSSSMTSDKKFGSAKIGSSEVRV